MARRLLSILFVACLAVSWPGAGRRARAQQPAPQDSPPADASAEAVPPSYSTPPAITLVEGAVRLVRQGQSQAAVASMPLVEGDRIVTEGGRVAVTFPDGSLLHVDRNTTVDFLSMNLVRMLDGRAIFVAAGQGDQRTVDYQVDAPSGSVRIQTAGEYKVAASRGEVELDVITGSASLATDQGSVRVEAGERSFAQEGEAPSYAEAFNSAQLDAFDQWSEQQREANTAEASSPSTEYLPSDLYPYSSTFDRYGRWQNDATYGEVWYPTVNVGWRPYYNGYWDYVGPYGWTWVGLDAWAWPTHHWGRWGFRAGLWFWVPRRYWAPAWVSWGYAPGYYSWCPLDFYNRPLISLNFFFGGHRGYRGAFDPWLCWTVLPRDRFGRDYHVSRYALAGDRLPAAARGGFAARRGGPDAPFASARAFGRGESSGGARPAPRALASVTGSARPRDAMFRSGPSIQRGMAAPRSAITAPRSDRRSLPFSAPAQRYDRGAAQNGAVARGATRPPAYDSRGPSSRIAPRGYDRPGEATIQPRGGQAGPRAYQPAQPRGYRSAPYVDRPPSSVGGRSTAQPRGGSASTAQRYSPPPMRGQPYSAPRYSNPGPERYSAPATPRYSAPAAPRYSAPTSRPSPTPRYSAPPTSRYSAPPQPRYSAPSYSAPRPSPPSYSAPASPRYSAPSYSPPRSAPSYSPPPRSAPSYSAPRSGGGGGPRSAGPAPSSRPSGGGSSSRPSGGGSSGGSARPRGGGGRR